MIQKETKKTGIILRAVTLVIPVFLFSFFFLNHANAAILINGTDVATTTGYVANGAFINGFVTYLNGSSTANYTGQLFIKVHVVGGSGSDPGMVNWTYCLNGGATCVNLDGWSTDGTNINTNITQTGIINSMSNQDVVFRFPSASINTGDFFGIGPVYLGKTIQTDITIQPNGAPHTGGASWGCLATSLSEAWNCSMTNPNPSINYVYPTNGTTTENFTNYILSIANVTTTDSCKIETSDAIPQVLTRQLTPQTFPCSWLLNSGIAVYKPQIPIQYFNGATSTAIVAQATLTDLTSGAVATTSITYILPSQFTTMWQTSPENVSGTIVMTYTTTTVTSTYPSYETPTSSVAMFQVATSTCAGWTDITCEVGNVFANATNFLFGINQSDIEAIAGFSLSQTRPFNTITDIQNAFQGIDTSHSDLQSSTLQFNLGNGNHSATWFNPTLAKQFMSQDVINFIRSILLACMTILLIYGFYVEIKRIFHQKK